jgi:hypothetical protein
MAKLTGGLFLSICTVLVFTSGPAAETVVGDIHIYGPDEVLDFCSPSGGETRMTFPGARSWVLLDGWEDYHAMPAEQVVGAAEAVTFPMDWLRVNVLILPGPRLGLPNSSSEGDVVFLSPGRVPYREEHVHYTLTHEIGHVVHHLLMPDYREDLWRAYAEIRMVEYSDPASLQPHASRLHEIFAEDFRVLFGGEISRCGGEVENHDIARPDEVEGLRDFFLSLVDGHGADGRIVAYPNPFESNMVVRLAGSHEDAGLSEVAVVDVLGRTVRVIRPSYGDRLRVVWDGRDTQGRVVAPGVYMVTARTAEGLHIHKVVKALR